jgi:uncharacterized protein YdeI (YjbR/CyaY-like superfamily)
MEKNTSAQVDAYIARAAPFAQPILKKLRRLFHQACPQIEEKIKWGVPSFEYQGMVGGMAAFKQHASFGFWKRKLLSDPHGLFKKGRDSGMFGTKMTDVADLPADDILISYIQEAVALNEKGMKVARPKPKKGKPSKVPDYFLTALKKNKKALAAFESFSTSQQRDYVEWITEAKQEETRARRLQTALEWLAEGKHRNWKYEKC